MQTLYETTEEDEDGNTLEKDESYSELDADDYINKHRKSDIEIIENKTKMKTKRQKINVQFETPR